jgi:hypothetical protein
LKKINHRAAELSKINKRKREAFRQGEEIKKEMESERGSYSDRARRK